MAKTFLTAEWRKLAMANYGVDPGILKKYLPYKTELDHWNGICFVSLVGFRFVNTRVKGLRIPFHSNFEEVNLRFYVRYKSGDTWRRGVVFIREIVPKPALTLVANTLYKEHYVTMPMSHQWVANGDSLITEYQWKYKDWHSLKLVTGKDPVAITAESEEEFITDHYWGYTKVNGNKTSEYEVQHPRWQVYPVKEHHIQADFGLLYGPEFRFLATEKPKSVLLAEGSEIVVKSGGKI
jgi:hypothetical protein